MAPWNSPIGPLEKPDRSWFQGDDLGASSNPNKQHPQPRARVDGSLIEQLMQPLVQGSSKKMWPTCSFPISAHTGPRAAAPQAHLFYHFAPRPIAAPAHQHKMA